MPWETPLTNESLESAFQDVEQQVWNVFQECDHLIYYGKLTWIEWASS